MKELVKNLIQQKIIVVFSIVFAIILVYITRGILANFITIGSEKSQKEMDNKTNVMIQSFERALAKKVMYQAGISRNPIQKPRKVAIIEREQKFPAKPKPPEQGRKEYDFSNFVLQGVIWNDKQKLAIISGNVVSKGETVEGAKVLNITKDGVMLLKDGIEIRLTR